MDPYERYCRALLRVYPRRYREERGAELLATLLDMAEPGQRRPPLRDSWDLARSGVVARWRAHPPLRLLGKAHDERGVHDR